MSSIPKLQTAETLTPLVLQHDSQAYSPVGEPLLLLDLHAFGNVERHLLNGLRDLAAPVVGVGKSASEELMSACDCVVDNVADAKSMISNIRQRPLAAMVLVQLLRLTEKLPLADALTAESLAYATLQSGSEFRTWRETHRSVALGAVEPGPAVLIKRTGETLRLTLNRPANRNAMTVEMRDALCEALQLAIVDDGIARIAIDGAGKCFSTGGDLREFGTAPDSATAHMVRSLALPGRLLAACSARVEVRVHGACIGSGIEFPAFAGRLVAAPDAWFQLPELKYGLIPGAGGCVSLSRRIGRQRTGEMVLSGMRIGAPQALAWGLVDAIEA